MAVLVGVGGARVLAILCGRRWSPTLAALAALPAIAWGLEHLLLTRVNPLTLVAFAAGGGDRETRGGGVSRLAIGRRARRVLGDGDGINHPGGAWTVGEPGSTDPAVARGNGIVVAFDTHALFLEQAVVILKNDGHVDVAGFLRTADPNAPRRRDPKSGRPLATTESYLGVSSRLA